MALVRGIVRWVLPWIDSMHEETDYGVWDPAEEWPPTGRNYIRPPEGGSPSGGDNEGPFGPWRPGGRT